MPLVKWRGAPDLLVIGAGIAGLTVALEAAARGLRVLVVDEPRPGSASRAAAGMLAPSVEGMPSHALPAALAARDLYPTFLRGLRERTEIDVPLDRHGILELADSSEHLTELAARSPTAAVLETGALSGLEPTFAGRSGALLHAHDGAVDNVRLMEALEQAVTRTPAIEWRLGAVVSVELTTDSVQVTTRDGAHLSAARLLLTGGAWAGGIAGLPRALPVRPVRGQLLRLGARGPAFVTYAGGGYLVPRGDSLLVGATSEETGFANATTDDGRDALLAIARRSVPALAESEVVAHWAGLRPMSPDLLPILGPDPEHRALWYACGFSRNGILFGPWAAEQLGIALTGSAVPAALEPFRIERLAS